MIELYEEDIRHFIDCLKIWAQFSLMEFVLFYFSDLQVCA
jgi:hypothetical protein